MHAVQEIGDGDSTGIDLGEIPIMGSTNMCLYLK